MTSPTSTVAGTRSQPTGVVATGRQCGATGRLSTCGSSPGVRARRMAGGPLRSCCSLDQLPTAVTTFNDHCAVGVIDRLARAGVAVPERGLGCRLRQCADRAIRRDQPHDSEPGGSYSGRVGGTRRRRAAGGRAARHAGVDLGTAPGCAWEYRTGKINRLRTPERKVLLFNVDKHVGVDHVSGGSGCRARRKRRRLG